MKEYRVTIINKIYGIRTRTIMNEENLKDLTNDFEYDGMRYENEYFKVYADEIRENNPVCEVMARINFGESFDSAFQTVFGDE